jgi:dienelactone hydrolase
MTQGADPTALARLPSRSHEEAPLATTRGLLPVLLMSHALGSASPLVYASTAEALAARGYVVVGISHTFDALATFFGDGGVAFRDLGCGLSADASGPGATASYSEIATTRRHYESMDAYLAADVDSALEQLDRMNATDPTFAGRLQLQRVGVFGHSFGGAHAFRALRESARVAAAANIDGALYAPDFTRGVNKPYLSISSADTSPTPSQMAGTVDRLTAQGLSADEAANVMRWNLSMRATFEASSPAYHVFMPMALHANFTDAGLWDAWGVPASEQDLNIPDASAILDLQNALLGRFFDRHLRGLAVAVALPAASLSGATLETR